MHEGIPKGDDLELDREADALSARSDGNVVLTSGPKPSRDRGDEKNSSPRHNERSSRTLREGSRVEAKCRVPVTTKLRKKTCK